MAFYLAVKNQITYKNKNTFYLIPKKKRVGIMIYSLNKLNQSNLT